MYASMVHLHILLKYNCSIETRTARLTQAPLYVCATQSPKTD